MTQNSQWPEASIPASWFVGLMLNFTLFLSLEFIIPGVSCDFFSKTLSL